VGIIYIAFCVGSMAMVRNLENGKILIWYIFWAGWATDVFAYSIGRRFGKHKFSKVSPKKSIEGCVAGTIGAIIVALVYTYFINTYSAVQYSYINISIISLILNLVGQVGDFAASTIKRYVEIKDYGNLIPGHGGMLDRIDSIMFIAPFAYMLLNLL
jgi:phosphatidate cytidylyltransferase